MGSIIRPLLFAALLVPAPVLAQQAETPATGLSIPPAGTTTPAPDANRQGPELNVYRDPVTPRAAPPVVAPTVTPPATVKPTVQPTPQPTPARPAATRPTTPAPRETAPEPRAQRPADRATPPPATPALPDDDTADQNAPVDAAPPPAPVANAAQAPAPVATPAPSPAPAAQDSSPLPWIIGGALALIALAAALLLRRRRPAAPLEEDAPEAPVAPPAPPPAARPAAATPPAPEPETAPAADNRAWLDMDMAVGQARYSLAGVTIAYSLILHNRGDRPAQDILIRGIVGNAGAQQAELLQGFFAGDAGLPLHSAVGIAPGETVQITGELRLPPDQIMPVTMGERSLLIPLAAFDMAYRWDGQGDAPDQGRTARAFIVGQEQEPPADRLAPLRLDQGPRQYRRPAARAAAELTPA